jgi:hypothetical protein
VSVRIPSTKRWWFRRSKHPRTQFQGVNNLIMKSWEFFFDELQRHHRQEWGGNFAKTRRFIEATFSSSSLSLNSPTVFFFPPRAIQCASVLQEHGSQKAGFTLREPADHFHYGQQFLAKLRWQLDLSNQGKLWEWECGVEVYNSLPLVC